MPRDPVYLAGLAMYLMALMIPTSAGIAPKARSLATAAGYSSNATANWATQDYCPSGEMYCSGGGTSWCCDLSQSCGDSGVQCMSQDAASSSNHTFLIVILVIGAVVAVVCLVRWCKRRADAAEPMRQPLRS